MNVVLANIDYLKHTSSEGHELQRGLSQAGWAMAGVGFDGLTDCGDILRRYKPVKVFVQDVRDWLPSSPISYRKDIGFTNLEALRESGLPIFTVLKDAHGMKAEQSSLCETIKPKAILAYYHPPIVRELAPWTAPYDILRIHHTVDSNLINPYMVASKRKDALVSGMVYACYPIRRMAFESPEYLGLDTLSHPGYGNSGWATPEYLKLLCTYKVHLATTSKYGYALRKIIESVCCGVTPITNLPESDVLPVIDKALVRIPNNITKAELRDVIAWAVKDWNWDYRVTIANEARRYYDYVTAGFRLDKQLKEVCRVR